MRISCLGNKTMAFCKCESRTAVAEVLEAKAPNPAMETTKVLYNYKNKDAAKTIEIRDMQGRFLNAWEVKAQTGTIEIDCTRYAGGQYFIVMKENDAVIKQARLLINN